ncbi:tRNA (adenosine(37)-N6)-threonylcarbamoyltransferase complex dimerization subunit type 1 TsaB [Piscinibacter sakaiensis]|uniref:tRNA (adenosine(37)-N6)-threonylcarbamoyltransferase complex dimerization subunit type 1 TsaB n=1 Tax=Piscinibacter sakaiensis TaxID=1547922 RepID=UPI00372A8CFF
MRAGDGVWPALADGGAQASTTLIPQALALLERAGQPLAGLDAIAFGAGPGAFTGLRTACAVAQGLAFGIDRPVLALDSLAVVAEAAADDTDGAATDADKLWVAQDARMDEVYAAAYRRRRARPSGPGPVPETLADPVGAIAWEPLVAPALYAPGGPAAARTRPRRSPSTCATRSR